MDSLKKLFSYMNDINFPYVVLRNWDGLPYDVKLGEHSDLDLLVYDFDHFFEIFPEAKLEFPKPRVRTRIPVEDSYIYADIRSVGDDYYPVDFQQAILDTRELNVNGFYTPDPMHHRIALAYHAVHHKGGISNEYTRFLGDATTNELLEALKQSNIGWVKPKDHTVGTYNAYWKGATSITHIDNGNIIKTQTSYNKHKLIDNEYRILSCVESKHFPKILHYGNDSITIEHCGEPLTEDNLPTDWKEQFQEILKELHKYNVLHRDIRLDNLMIKDGIIMLIDFGWAKFKNEEDTIEPPSCLGYPNKSSYGFNDVYSMNCVERQLQYQMEEKGIHI